MGASENVFEEVSTDRGFEAGMHEAVEVDDKVFGLDGHIRLPQQ